jgi:Mlc titration factor MtfA (ptsG expression regulator)
MFGLRRWRRRRLLRRPFPPAWRSILERNVPYYGLLPEADRRALRDLVRIFIAENTFEGCGGLELTDEIRVSIAAQACILLLHRGVDRYRTLRTILVYPHTYVVERGRRQPDGTVIEGPQPRHGESWHHGAVVLSWHEVKRGAADIDDGRNVVFHEFAHQLDNESGAAEGAPALGPRSRYLAWARVLGREYAELTEAVDRHRPTVLDAYGATSPAEFFAVATESFFERPRELRDRHSELYEELRRFYGQDPAALRERSRDRD